MVEQMTNAVMVMADCWRRGPDGSVAVYDIRIAVPVRYVTDRQTLSDADAARAAGEIAQALLDDLLPPLYRAIREAQGVGADLQLVEANDA